MKKLSKLMVSLAAVVMLLVVFSVFAFAEDNIQVVVDTTGETGYQVEISETSASIPIVINAGNNELDTSSWLCFFKGPSRLDDPYGNDDMIPVTIADLTANGDGTYTAKATGEGLETGKAYYFIIAEMDPVTYDIIFLSNTYSFVTAGNNTQDIQWGDNTVNNQTQVQVIYRWNGAMEVADSGSGIMADWTASGQSPWSIETSVYYATTQSIDIINGVKHIGNYTFSPMINVTTVTTGQLDPLTSIGEYSFKGCTSLRDVYLYADAEDMDIADTAFDGCSDVTIHVKPDQLEAYRAKFPNLANVTFAGDLTPDAPVDPTFALTSSEGTDLKAKKHTNLTAEVTNGNVEDYTYKFIVYNKTSNQWYKLRDFDAANTFDWYTGPAGEKTLYVDVKDAEGNVTREALDVTVADSTLKVDSFTIDPTGELATKTQAALSATASGGAGEYQYKFIVYNDTTKQWYKLKDFGPESTFDWYTGPAGTKTLYVDVKDADGTVVRAPLDVTVA